MGKIFKHNKQILVSNPETVRNRMGMMTMLQRLGIKHTGRHHSGIDDVKNICKIVQKMLMKGVQFDYTTKQFQNGNISNDIKVKDRLKKLGNEKASTSSMIHQIDECILTLQSAIN